MSVSPDHPSGSPSAPTTAELREPAHRVSPRARLTWAVSAALEEAFVLLGLVVVQAMGWWDVWWWIWPLWLVGTVVHVAVVPPLRYRRQRWETTDSAVYTQTGLLGRELRIAPMSRVQTVDLEQGPIERLLGLASVTVTTASAAGPLQIRSVDREVAEHLVLDLTRRAEAEADDAT